MKILICIKRMILLACFFSLFKRKFFLLEFFQLIVINHFGFGFIRVALNEQYYRLLWQQSQTTLISIQWVLAQYGFTQCSFHISVVFWAGQNFSNSVDSLQLQLLIPANFPCWKNFACWKFPRWKSVAGNAGKMEFF